MNHSHHSLHWLACLMALCTLLGLAANLSVEPAQAGSATQASTITTDIVADTTWTSAGSPYLVVAPIRVISAATLTIEAGVLVEFAANAGLRIEGGLNAQGQQAQQVRLIGQNGATWQGVTAAQPAGSVSLRSVAIRNAIAGLAIRQQVLALAKAGGRVDVFDSLFESNGVGIDADYSVATNAPRLTLRNSLLTNNRIGLQMNGLPNGNIKPKFNHNSFTGNGIGVNALNITGKGIKLQQQWWGSASGPLPGNPTSCASPPAPGADVRDLVCGSVDFSPWNSVPAGRVRIPAGQSATLESALGQAALNDDDITPTSIMTLTVPAGAFTQTVDLLVTPRDDVPFAPANQSTLLTFELTAAAGEQEIHQFANGRQLTIEIAYTSIDINGIDPRKLALYYYDETRKVWSTAGITTTPNPANNRISARLTHLTRFRTSAAEIGEAVQIFIPLLRR